MFTDIVGLKVHVVQDGEHTLPKVYVGSLLDKLLAKSHIPTQTPKNELLKVQNLLTVLTRINEHDAFK